METIQAHELVGVGFPTEEGAKLATAIIDRGCDLSQVAVDLRELPASMLISGFFHGYLLKFQTSKPELLEKARATRWVLRHPFQTENATRWTKEFRTGFT